MGFMTEALIFLLLSIFSNSLSERKATPEEELEDVEKIVSEMADMGFHDAEADGVFEEEVDEILWDGLNGEHDGSDEGIVRKSYDSGKGEETSEYNLVIEETTGKDLALNTMPKFYGEMVAQSKSTFTIKLSHEKLPNTIPFYEIVVLKLSTDSEGYPRLPKESSRTWQTFIPYTKEPTAEHPYIAARFARDDLPRQFTVGDKIHYGGSYNGCLKPGSFFVMFIRGSQKHGDTINHVVSDYISSINEPNIAYFFHTESAPKVHVLQLGLGLLAGLIVITATFVVVRHRQENKKYAAVKDDDSGWSDIDESSVKKTNSSTKRKKLSTLNYSNTATALKNVTDNKDVSRSEIEISSADDSVSDGTAESLNKMSGSQNKVLKKKLTSMKAGGGDNPTTGSNYKAVSKLSNDLVSPREDTFSKGKSDKGTRAESITANTETGISTSNSHGDKKGRKSGETKKKSGGKEKSDRTSLTITSSGGGGEDIVRFRERRKLSEELLEVEQSDNKTKDVDIGGYGMKRDKRNDKEYKAALRRRLEAYRWLINLKQDKKISPNVDIKLVLAGKLDLPQETLKEKPAHIDLERLKWDVIAYEENDINSTGAELLT